MPTPKQGYRNAVGEKVPSVTTILGRFKDADGLIKWAYKQGREHENLVSRNLPAPGHLYDVSGKAAEAGTIAHDMVESYIKVGPDAALATFEEAAKTTTNDVVDKAYNAYLQFRKWWAQTNITVTDTEMGLVSEQHQYGGTPDAMGFDGDQPDMVAVAPGGAVVLIDWKTSNKVYGEMLIQLAAYSILIEECLGKIVKGAHLVRMSKENADFAHHYYGDLTREREAFLLMRKLYDHVKVIEKRA